METVSLKKVLCVDDEANVLNNLRRVFVDAGYLYFSAESAVEAITLIKAIGSTDIIISDYRMPGSLHLTNLALPR